MPDRHGGQRRHAVQNPDRRPGRAGRDRRNMLACNGHAVHEHLHPMVSGAAGYSRGIPDRQQPVHEEIRILGGEEPVKGGGHAVQ